MSGTEWAVVTGIGAAGAAGCALLAAHFVSLILAGDRVHVLGRYVAGCSLIVLFFGGWCLVQPGMVPGWWALLALVGVVAGAGLGTAAGYLVDWIAGQLGMEAVRRGQQGAGADRGR